jgi:hypothetical protein
VSTPSPGRTAVLSLVGWAVAVPFFVLPGPLTIEASDIYGGFGLHLRLAAALAMVGLAIGAARRWLGPRADRPAAGSPTLDGAIAALLLVLLAAVVHGLAVGAATPAFLGPMAHAGGEGITAVGTLAALILLARAGLDRTEGSAARLLAVAGLLWLGLLTLQLLVDAERLPGAARWGLVLVAVAAAAAWGRLARWGPRARFAWLALGALPFVLAGAHVGARMIGPGRSVPGALLGAVVLGAVGVQLLRRASRGPSDGPPWRLPWLALGQALLLVALVVGCRALLDRSTSLAESWAFLLEPVRGPLYDAGSSRGGPPQVGLLWLLAVAVGAVQADTIAAVRRWLGACSALWALLVLAQLAGLGGGGLALPLAALLAVPLALAWPWLLGPTRFDVSWGALAAGALIGPVLLKTLLGATMLQPPGAGVLIALGGLLGLGAALPLAGRAPGAAVRVGAGTRLAGLLVAGVVGVMPVYVAVCLGLYPGWTGALALGCLGAGIAGWWRLRQVGHLGWIAPLIAGWLFFYGCTAAMTWFKEGPSEASCAQVLATSPARVLLDRFEEGGDYVSAQPYDVLPLADPGVLLASFKRIAHEPGFVELLELDRPTVRSRLVTRRPGPYPSWPERMEYDALRGGVLTQVLGREDYALQDLHLLPPEGDGAHRLWVAFELPLAWEPGNPALDRERRRLVVSFVPNREARNPLARVWDLDELQPLGDLTRPGGRLEMADYAAIDPDSGRAWIPAWYDASRFVVVGFDADGGVHRQRETAAPGVGLVLHGDRLITTSSLAGGLLVFDLEELSLRQALPAGRFPRDLVLDRRRERLYVGGYADGVVYAFSTAGPQLEPLFEVPVGSLLRGLGLDPVSGRVYAASGCGLFEVAGPDGALPVR